MKLASISITAATLAAIASCEAFKPFGEVSSDALFEQFNYGDDEDASWEDFWKVSHAKRDGEFSYVGRWEVEESSAYPGLKGDKGLVVKSPAAHHAISRIFKESEIFDNKGKDLVLQYEVKTQEGLNCGGAYIKLLSNNEKLHKEEFNNDTPYQVMFGPDKCGATNKVHFIVKRPKHDDKVNYEEKHLRTPPMSKVSKLTTLYTLIIKKNNDFEIRINGEVAKAGNLLDENLFEPSFNPPKEIEDFDDTKPEDWDDRIEIPDPEETEKPADWDEDAPKMIPDPEAKKPEDWLDDAEPYIPDPEAYIPEDWDEEEDGEWIAPEIPNPACEEHGCGKWTPPMIANPDYKGKWKQPMIANPDYKGEWAPRKIPNPDYYEDVNASDLEPIGGLGFELWTMDKNILFDNIYLGHSIEEAEKIGNATFVVKHELESAKHKEDIDASVEKPDEPDFGLKDELAETSITETLKTTFEDAKEYAQNFLLSANQYLLEFGENPAKVLDEKPVEGLVYIGVFSVIGTLFFGVIGIAMLKLTSNIDDSVDATADGKSKIYHKKAEEKEKEKKAKAEKVEEIKEEAKTTSAVKSETSATKRK